MVAIQVRDVPDAVRLALVREAESRGQSLQMFLLDVLEREGKNARNREALRTHKPIRLRGSGTIDATSLIRKGREERDREILNATVGSTEADRIIELSRAIDDRR